MRRILLTLLLLSAGILPLIASPIGLRIPDTTFTRGTSVYLPVYIDSSVTGLNVTSYQIQLTYFSSTFTIDTVISNGTLSVSWGTPTVHSLSGVITIAGAGTSALIGKGVLMYLKVRFPITVSSGYSPVQFANALLNEGTPSVIVQGANVYINNPPTITVYPDDGLLTITEQRQFNAYGGTEPYKWSTTDTSVAKIDTNGLLTAYHTGKCGVIAKDHSNIVDTTSMIEVRAFRLTVRDTTVLQGQTFLMPVYISDLTGINILSGSFTLTYDAAVLTALGAEKSGTILSSFSDPTVHIGIGSITIGFANATRLNGIGIQKLINIRFKVSDVGNYSTMIQFLPMSFNENISGIGTNGYFIPTILATLTISPSTYKLVKGDSVQFNAGGSISLPLTWSVTDTLLATISSSGKLKAKKGGEVKVNVRDSVGAKGQTNVISLFDASIGIPAINTMRGDTILVPIRFEGNISNLFSLQLSMSYNQSYFFPVGFSTTGTLLGSGGWSVSAYSPTPGSFNLAAAGSNSVSGTGNIINIKVVISGSTPQGNYDFAISNILCNEGYPIVMPSSGIIHVDTSFVLSMQVSSSWNMISLPLMVNDYRRPVLFPNALSSAFYYSNGYWPVDTLTFGTGYWIKFGSPETITISGSPSSLDTIDVVNGWNMIGTISYPVLVSEIIPIGTTAPPFAFDFALPNGYTSQSTLQPGRAYWVKVNGAGKLVLRASSLTK